MNIFDLLTKGQEKAKEITPVSDKQWVTYQRLCKQKWVSLVERTSLTAAAMSTEIERLISLPFARAAYPQQITKFKELCAALSINCPTDDVIKVWSNVAISEKITALSAHVPATENQMKMITNFWRFGLLTDDEVVAGTPFNQASASAIIGRLSEDYQTASDGKLTLNQANRIVQLEKSLHNKEIDVRSLNEMSFDDASAIVEKLKQEVASNKLANATAWDNSGSMYNLDTDTSRNVDDERYDTMSFADKEYSVKMDIVRKLQNIVNVGNDDNDSEISEDNIDDIIVDLYGLASVIGEKAAAYGVMNVAVESEPQKITKKGGKKSQG